MPRRVLYLFLLGLAVVACGTPVPTPAAPTVTAPAVAVADTATPDILPTVAPTALPDTPTATPESTLPALTCEDLEGANPKVHPVEWYQLNCGFQPASPTAAPPVAPPLSFAPPTPVAPLGPQTLTYVIRNQIVTALYVAPSGAIYYGGPQNAEQIGDPTLGGYAVWKKPANGDPIRLTPNNYNLIGGIILHDGTIYFNEGGSATRTGNLRRMPDDGQEHPGDVVLHYSSLSVIYGHVNHALAPYTVNGQDALLMAVGTTIDSSYDLPMHPSGIQPPWYEPFPTGRINYAYFSWLDVTSNYQVTQGVGDQFEEYARGFRNPWAMTTGTINGQPHVFAVDNDPSFTPEKLKSSPGAANSGDEVNDVYQNKDYGHPFAYAGAEPAWGDVPPIVTFPNGSVPSGVAVAAGKLFVSLHDAGMIVRVDIVNHTWRPVITNIQPFNLYGIGNLLYVADFSGIRVIDARGL